MKEFAKIYQIPPENGWRDFVLGTVEVSGFTCKQEPPDTEIVIRQGDIYAGRVYQREHLTLIEAVNRGLISLLSSLEAPKLGDTPTST